METREVTITVGEAIKLNTELNGSANEQFPCDSLVSETVDGGKKYLLNKIAEQAENEAKEYEKLRVQYVTKHGKEIDGQLKIQEVDAAGKITPEYTEFLKHVDSIMVKTTTLKIPTELTLEDVLATNCKGNFKVIYSILEQ